MERSEKASSTESTSDNSEKSSKKSSKKRVSHVPLPLDTGEIEEREARRIHETIAEAAETDKPAKKKKRRRRRKSSDETPKTEQTEPETEKPKKSEKLEKKSKNEDRAVDTDKEEDVDQIEKGEQSDTSKPLVETATETAEVAEVPLDGGYQGELLVSERARRQRMRHSPARETSSEPSEAVPDTEPSMLEQPEANQEPEPRPEPRTERSRRTVREAADEATAESTPEQAELPSSSDGGNEPPDISQRRGFSAFNPFNRETRIVPPQQVATETAPAPEVRRDRTSERRHLLTGLIVGGLIEHVRHRRREKRMAQEQGKEISKMEVMASRTKTNLEKQIERLQQDVKDTKERVQETSKEVMQRPKETVAARPVAEVAQQPEQPTSAELDIKSAREKLEQAIAAQEAEQEEVKLPDDRRVETSAWHRIEVDKRTGRAVEAPVIAYGKEFENEQHQEQLRREIEAASMAGAAMKQQHKTEDDNNDQRQIAATSQDKQDATPAKKAMKRASDTVQSLSVEPIDIVLWIILIIIIGAIIRVLSA